MEYNFDVDDSLKIEMFKQTNNEDYKAYILSILSDDILKIQMMKYIKEDYNRATVISSINDTSLKLEEAKKIKNEFLRATIIASINDDLLKVKYIKDIQGEVAKVYIINTLQDDNIRARCIIEELQNNIFMLKELKNIENDGAKKAILDTMSNEFQKALIISTFQDDELKITELEKLNSDFAKVYAIGSLSDKGTQIDEVAKIPNKLIKALFLAWEFYYIAPKPLLQDRSKMKEALLNEKNKYKNVGLNKDITFGIEIEAQGLMSSKIKRMTKFLSGWKTEAEVSICNGVETVSKILTDQEDDIEEVYIMCSLLQNCGLEINDECGGHIHIGASYLKSTIAYENLFEIWGNSEKIIYKICNEQGTLPRKGTAIYAKPISNRWEEAIKTGSISLQNEDDLNSFVTQIQRIQFDGTKYLPDDRYYTMNLLNINNVKNTIEFRLPNGTLNPDTWIENIRLFGRIIQLAQELAEIKRKPEKSEEDKRKQNLKNCLKKPIPEQEKFKILLELLFNEDERQIYIDRYNSCTKLLEQEPEHPLNHMSFGKVDFGKEEKTRE